MLEQWLIFGFAMALYSVGSLRHLRSGLTFLLLLALRLAVAAAIIGGGGGSSVHGQLLRHDFRCVPFCDSELLHLTTVTPDAVSLFSEHSTHTTGNTVTCDCMVSTAAPLQRLPHTHCAHAPCTVHSDERINGIFKQQHKGGGIKCGVSCTLRKS